MPQIAVVLSGCGVYDGTEVHEAAAALGKFLLRYTLSAALSTQITLIPGSLLGVTTVAPINFPSYGIQLG